MGLAFNKRQPTSSKVESRVGDVANFDGTAGKSLLSVWPRDLGSHGGGT